MPAGALAGQVHVQLTQAELREAAMLGVERVVASAGRKPRFPYRSGEVWRAHVMGALGEAVVRKYTRWPWPKGVNVFRSIQDVGGCEVRWCGEDEAPYLKVRDDERTKERCISVTGDVTTGGFVIRGWLIAADAPFVAGAAWMEVGASSYWRVPHGGLKPIGELVEIVQEELARAGSSGNLTRGGVSTETPSRVDASVGGGARADSDSWRDDLPW